MVSCSIWYNSEADTDRSLCKASVSPNGRMMLMVADNGKAYLYEITESGDYKQKSVYEGNTYQEVSHTRRGCVKKLTPFFLTVSDEPALSCAWNQSSEKFAVTSQDGYVSVWNVEQSEPLCRIGSTETRKTRKAPRSIQFSKGPLDLLAYAEHVSTVNIVDTRTFQSRQVVRLSPIDVDYHITGLAFSPDNRSLFVGRSPVFLSVLIMNRLLNKLVGIQVWKILLWNFEWTSVHGDGLPRHAFYEIPHLFPLSIFIYHAFVVLATEIALLAF